MPEPSLPTPSHVGGASAPASRRKFLAYAAGATASSLALAPSARAQGAGRIAGIEAMNVFGGSTCLDVGALAKQRKFDPATIPSLLLKEKSVALPYEDPVSFAVNAAKPIIDELSDAERDRIELLITCTESGIDFSKSLSSYVHEHLGLNRNCRMFELKQGSYSGTAGLQMAVSFILSQASPGAKALVVATDVSRPVAADNSDYSELSSASGAVAMLIGESPYVFQIDLGASGYYGHEVADRFRPEPDEVVGDTDLATRSYLDGCEQSFLEYAKRVDGVDYGSSFSYLCYHAPWGGMVKAAHRSMMQKQSKAKPEAIEADFKKRVLPGLEYPQRVGNLFGGSVLLSLASAIDHATLATPVRLGCFSYGSGCCSEFFSGVLTPAGQGRLKKLAIKKQLDARHQLTMAEYDSLLGNHQAAKQNARLFKPDTRLIPQARKGGGERLFLREIKEYHREYEWL